MQRERAWVHRMRGEDPDDPAVATADLIETFERTAKMLEQVMEEEGIDASVVPPAPPTPLMARHLQDAGRTLVERAHAIESHAIGRDVEVLRNGACLITMKLWRLACYLDLEEPPTTDAAANRILLERLDEDVRGALLRLSRMLPAELVAPCESARVEIARLLELAFGPVPDEVRVELRARVTEGRAPSPFCVRPVL
jgi:hypothetical protein